MRGNRHKYRKRHLKKEAKKLKYRIHGGGMCVGDWKSIRNRGTEKLMFFKESTHPLVR